MSVLTLLLMLGGIVALMYLYRRTAVLASGPGNRFTARLCPGCRRVVPSAARVCSHCRHDISKRWRFAELGRESERV